MTGTILDVIDGTSIWLLIVGTGDRVVEQVVEPRYMAGIVEGEEAESPHNLIGREVELSEDGLTIGFVHEGESV